MKSLIFCLETWWRFWNLQGKSQARALSEKRGRDALVHRAELGDVETVGKHSILAARCGSAPLRFAPSSSQLRLTRLALEQVLALVRGDVRDGREDVGAVGGAALDAVAVVDAALARLVVDVEVLQVVVKVDTAGAEVPAEQGRVGGEDGRDVECAPAAEGDRDSCEVGETGSARPRAEIRATHQFATRGSER